MTDDEKNKRIRQLMDNVELAVTEIEGCYFNGDFPSLWTTIRELRELTVQPTWLERVNAQWAEKGRLRTRTD